MLLLLPERVDSISSIFGTEESLSSLELSPLCNSRCASAVQLSHLMAKRAVLFCAVAIENRVGVRVVSVFFSESFRVVLFVLIPLQFIVSFRTALNVQYFPHPFSVMFVKDVRRPTSTRSRERRRQAGATVQSASKLR